MENSASGHSRVCEHGIVASLLDQLQARGYLVSSLPYPADTSGLSPLAVKRQIEHLADRVIRLPGRPSSYKIVAQAHRKRGAPPVDFWLADYCRVHDMPCYVGLLSAAARHGSANLD